MIPFSPPRIDDKIVDAVAEALRSGWISTGPRTKLFEEKISQFCGCPKTLCVSSCSAGLELMLRWFGVGPGDEVIVPAYTYAATANVVVHCGAKPVFADAATDFNIDVDKIADLITENTKVIIPVDIAGWPCNYNALNEIVARKDIREKFSPRSAEQTKLGRILVLADAAHSFGAKYHEKYSGQLADISVFSFHAVKNLTTAEGGAITLNLPLPFNNGEIYKYLCIKSLHGQTKDALAKMQVGNWKYDIVEPGYKMNMTDIQAAMGLVELERYENDHLVRRKQIFDLYSKILGEYDWAQIPEYQNEKSCSSYHVYLLRIRNISETQRDLIMQGIFSREVAVNVHFRPLPMMSYYRNEGYCIGDYPVAFHNFSCVISLPVFYNLTDDQVRTVSKAVIDSVKENK